MDKAYCVAQMVLCGGLITEGAAVTGKQGRAWLVGKDKNGRDAEAHRPCMCFCEVD